MIKDERVAQHVNDVLLACGANIDKSITYVKDNSSLEEFESYQRAMGKVMGEILLEALNPLYKEHPELKPEGFE